ncbi:MAG: hypothetical protein JWO90_50 [Solirubrobacterales bacterium]|jgi:uncharacterized membrane protein|nr:hypothetical protein [Solirubrobacterales bacterium]
MSAPAACSVDARAWSLERVLFAIAGTVVIVAAALSAVVSSWFLVLVIFVGVNQWLFVLVGGCPMSFVLRRVLGLRPAVSR